MPDSNNRYSAAVRALSDRIVDAQKPIRILDAIKWDASIKQAFFAAGCKKQPPVDAAYYQQRPLGFDPHALKRSFHEIERDVVRQLGQFNPVGKVMSRMCREYQMAIRLLEARGTPEFSDISQELYGAASDAFHAGDPSLADLGAMMAETLGNIDRGTHLPPEPRDIPADQAVSILQDRLAIAFAEAESPVRVILDDGIVADAAAGADYIKVRQDARFSMRDLRLLEVHEGWVHVGTTLNGQDQPVCTFLSKGPPSATVTQEGLAILMEIVAFASYPDRLRKLSNRIRAVSMAEQGATFLDVFGFFREQGFGDDESFNHAGRIFRGSAPTCGPFTKDLSYNKGFIMVYNFIQLAVRRGRLELIPLLFCGKVTLEDIPVLSQLVDEGLVRPPRYLPPQIADLNALAAWMSYSNFLNRLSMDRIEADYAHLV
ncbi:MAG: flavohemoglobin expression-modulating QEGLA motif protein [Aquisalimonadaceae bacterium]